MRHTEFCAKEYNIYLDGLGSNRLGTLSMGNETVVPLGPIIVLMQLVEALSSCAAFSCYQSNAYDSVFTHKNEVGFSVYLCQFIKSFFNFVFTLLPARILSQNFSNGLCLKKQNQDHPCHEVTNTLDAHSDEREITLTSDSLAAFRI